MSANRRNDAAVFVFAFLAMSSAARAVEPMESFRFKINAALEAAAGGNPFGEAGLPQVVAAVPAPPPPLILGPWVWLVPDPMPEPLPPPKPIQPIKPAPDRRKVK